jgi:hypothetical protein
MSVFRRQLLLTLYSKMLTTLTVSHVSSRARHCPLARTKRFSKLSYNYFLYFCLLHSWQTAIFWDPWDDQPTPCTHDIWWTLDFPSAFLSPGVNSRAELIPSTRAYAWNGEREVCTEKYRTEVFFEMIEPVRRARFVQKDRYF